MSARRAAALAVLAACVPPVDAEDLGCPCADGHVCCGGCQDRCVPKGEPCDDGALEVGLGARNVPVFEPLPADGRMVLDTRGQGGWHVYLQMRTGAFELGPVRLVRRVYAPDGCVLLKDEIGGRVALQTDPETGEGIIAGSDQDLVLCPPGPGGQRMRDRDLIVHVAVSPSGRDEPVLHRSVTIHPVCPEDGEQAADCGDLCAAP